MHAGALIRAPQWKLLTPVAAGVHAGVTEANWRAIMRSVSSLAELADTPLETLAEIMGGQVRLGRAKP
jgi:hypothetical protein